MTKVSPKLCSIKYSNSACTEFSSSGNSNPTICEELTVQFMVTLLFSFCMFVFQLYSRVICTRVVRIVWACVVAHTLLVVTFSIKMKVALCGTCCKTFSIHQFSNWRLVREAACRSQHLLQECFHHNALLVAEFVEVAIDGSMLMHLHVLWSWPFALQTEATSQTPGNRVLNTTQQHNKLTFRLVICGALARYCWSQPYANSAPSVRQTWPLQTDSQGS